MRCSPTFYSHPKASTVLSFLLLSPPPPYALLSYLVFTSQGEHGPIINTRPPPHPIKCSPTLISHPKGSTVLSFLLLSPPPPYALLSYLVFTSQGEHGPIINTRPPPHPIKCSPTLISHPKGSTVLSFPLDPPTPPYQVFSHLVFTSQGEHSPIIPTRPLNTTLSGVLLPCI